MIQDPASFDNLRDIAEAPPVPWWPPALGWWVVAGLAVIAVVAVMWRAWQRWHRNAYRRAALQELRQATTLPAIAGILKRTALSAWPREQVASLSGAEWCDWLRNTGSTDVPSAVADMLRSGLYGSEPLAIQPLTEFADCWIRNHRVGEERRPA